MEHIEEAREFIQSLKYLRKQSVNSAGEMFVWLFFWNARIQTAFLRKLSIGAGKHRSWLGQSEHILFSQMLKHFNTCQGIEVLFSRVFTVILLMHGQCKRGGSATVKVHTQLNKRFHFLNLHRKIFTWNCKTIFLLDIYLLRIHLQCRTGNMLLKLYLEAHWHFEWTDKSIWRDVWQEANARLQGRTRCPASCLSTERTISSSQEVYWLWGEIVKRLKCIGKWMAFA